MQSLNIDDRIIRVDAYTKARGEALYVSDLYFPDMQYAQMIRSEVPRGRIVSIDMPKLPKGYKFITARDIPEGGKNELWMIQKDWRCFADGDVRFVGDVIALLVVKDRKTLIVLKNRIKISYE